MYDSDLGLPLTRTHPHARAPRIPLARISLCYCRAPGFDVYMYTSLCLPVPFLFPLGPSFCLSPSTLYPHTRSPFRAAPHLVWCGYTLSPFPLLWIVNLDMYGIGIAATTTTTTVASAVDITCNRSYTRRTFQGGTWCLASIYTHLFTTDTVTSFHNDDFGFPIERRGAQVRARWRDVQAMRRACGGNVTQTTLGIANSNSNLWGKAEGRFLTLTRTQVLGFGFVVLCTSWRARAPCKRPRPRRVRSAARARGPSGAVGWLLRLSRSLSLSCSPSSARLCHVRPSPTLLGRSSPLFLLVLRRPDALRPTLLFSALLCATLFSSSDEAR